MIAVASRAERRAFPFRVVASAPATLSDTPARDEPRSYQRGLTTLSLTAREAGVMA
jgi:hypothetical protein